jgi:putative sigma-54 modulation protein
MKLELKGVHYDITQKNRDYIDKKMRRLSYADDLVVDLLLSITRDSREYKIEVNINFRWGTTGHIRVDNFNVRKGIDQLFDKLDNKIKKEKDKIQSH